MLETTITLLAIICAASVSTICVLRWRRTSGFKGAVYLGCAVFAAFMVLLNLTALFAAGESFIRTATLAYVGFATVIILPAARALGRLTYETPEEHDEPV